MRNTGDIALEVRFVNLELENVKGTQGSRKGREFEPAKPYGEATEETGSDLPTSYCTILFNDQLVYKTRSKAGPADTALLAEATAVSRIGTLSDQLI